MHRLSILVALLMAGCAMRTPAPVADRSPGVPAPEIGALPAPAGAPQTTTVQPPAPEKDWRPELYTVKRGDTLFAIALEYGLDYRELAAMNNIENVNVIRIGQVLRVRQPSTAPGAGPASGLIVAVPLSADARPGTPPAPARPSTERGNTDTYKSQPKAIKLPYSEAALAQLQAAAPKAESHPPVATAAPAAAASVPVTGSAPSSAPAVPAPATPAVVPPAAGDSNSDRVDWGWPARGKIISGYSESASLKGIDIGGAAGVPIVASAPGRVVYAGSGLRGYGKLVIVKHNKTYLSAYAHLDQIAIKEGQNVAKGQELGKMGKTDADQVKLHFEIRVLGKPVDPLRFLPRG